MRLQGRVVEWNDERGFGFVVQHGSKARTFIHISAFANRRDRPAVGDVITYEVRQDERKRLVAHSADRSGRRRLADAGPNRLAQIAAVFVLAVVLIAAGKLISIRAAHPSSSISATVYRAANPHVAAQSSSEFSCSVSKTSCSQMTSCAEALYYQEQCGVPNMDGDHDGIPCEQQWCN